MIDVIGWSFVAGAVYGTSITVLVLWAAYWIYEKDKAFKEWKKSHSVDAK